MKHHLAINHFVVQIPAPSESANKRIKRVKSSSRLVYEAQVAVIKRQIGELEGVRQQLGLNRKEICQLLMVDPSAWSRWLRAGEDAPPHIYRALQWFLLLSDKEARRPLEVPAEQQLHSKDKTQKLELQDLFIELDRLRSEVTQLKSEISTNHLPTAHQLPNPKEQIIVQPADRSVNWQHLALLTTPLLAFIAGYLLNF